MASRCAIVQSAFIPWKGYFDIINSVDKFVFLDTVNFSKEAGYPEIESKRPMELGGSLCPSSARLRPQFRI